MIYESKIEGLRGFASASTFEPALPNGSRGSGLTVLTGPNNSGKTTVIEAIRAFASTQADPSFHVGMRNPKTDEVKLSLVSDDRTSTVSSRAAGKSEAEYTSKLEKVPYVVPSRRQFSPFFGKTSPSHRDEFSKNSSSHTESRSSTLGYFEGRIFDLERDQATYNSVLLRVLPGLLDWSIDQSEQSQYFIKIRYKNKVHNLQGSGDGVLSIFVIIASLFDSNVGDVIVIDEPELSLHPRLQKNLAALLDEYSQDRQVIISTHSPYFISRPSLLNGGRIVRAWDRGGEIELCHVSRAGCVGLEALLSHNINNPHLFGLEAREIFFEVDPVILLEGQEDVVFWPTVDQGHVLSAASIFGWGSGGTSNMKHLCQVLAALGHKKVCGVLDNNRPQDLTELRAQYPEYLFQEIPAPDIRTKKLGKLRKRWWG